MVNDSKRVVFKQGIVFRSGRSLGMVYRTVNNNGCIT